MGELRDLPIIQNEGLLTGVGLVYKSLFTDRGATRQILEHDPDALSRAIFELGKERCEMVGSGTVTEHYHALTFKRPKMA